ncbi:hypothetical protein, partial [Paenibacillus alvei]|uniref:hypothetical protein n=1 Tax=Paenibacillus alvei TaxID=44250 RepID=UPI001E5CE918
HKVSSRGSPAPEFRAKSRHLIDDAWDATERVARFIGFNNFIDIGEMHDDGEPLRYMAQKERKCRSSIAQDIRCPAR